MAKLTRDVLIIDDDEGIRNLICIALQRAGLSCETATDGTEALERVRNVTFAVILLDIMMPRLDGYGFLSRYAESLIHDADRPVVLIMTAFPEHEVNVPFVADLVHGIIRKPFDVHEMASLV
ncbi:MAG TPA: response regulator, partial [Thermoanaerobaculia bacterium]|nr:response regulator [Thermoanaerobaculia bacterium]